MQKTNKKKIEEFIRVDHAGERGAIKIYEGQLLALNTIIHNEELKKKINEFKQSKNFGFKSNISTSTMLGSGLKLSIDLIASIFVGIMIGLGMDKLFSTKPIFFLIFLLLGVAAGFVKMYRSIINIEKIKKK